MSIFIGPRNRTKATLFFLSEQRYAVETVMTLCLRGLDVQFMFS
jgi:hypothetical protein